MIIKSIVVIDGKEVEVKELEDKEAFAESVNQRVLFDRNCVSGRKEGQAWKKINYLQHGSWN